MASRDATFGGKKKTHTGRVRYGYLPFSSKVFISISNLIIHASV